jgi:prepilin-type N-terminal cleavage/methylation domain-containing protein
MHRLVTSARRRGNDEGFTLVEMLVASIILAIILAVTMSVVVATNKVVSNSRDAQDLTEQARIAMNRMARELRQARDITAVTNPGVSSTLTASPSYTPLPTYNPNADTSLTFESDFNGDGNIDPTGPDPEVVTYKFDYANSQLLLQAGGQTLPVLASNVTGFQLNFTSRQINYDGTVDGVKNGVVDWEELDADPAMVKGNQNHLLDVELPYIDSVTITLTLFRGHHKQVFRTQVDLRNGAY